MNGAKRAIFSFLAVAVTVGALWYQHRPVAPKKAVWEDVVAEAERGGYRLIGTEELWEKYSKDPQGVLLVDTRQEWEYRTGHIKGAVNFPVEPTWLSRWQKKGDLSALLGPDKDQAIVFY